MKKAAKASGFEKDLRNVQSWQLKGKIVRLSDGTNGDFQAEVQQPNLYRDTINFKNAEISRSFNGKSTWMRDSRDGLRTLTGEASEDLKAEAFFRANRWLKYKEEKSIISSSGKYNLFGKQVDTVILTTAKNVKIKLYFDSVSGLLIREEIPFGDKMRVFDYGNFRVINGVQEPFTIKMSEGNERFEIQVEQILHNVPINRATFDFPSNPNERLPDIRAFLEEVKANQDEVDKTLENYSYVEEITDREFDKNGNLRITKVETFEVSNFKGKLISRLIARNGKPLSDKNQEKQDQDVQKEVEKMERNQDIKNQEPSIAEILRASNLVNPRRERFKGREVIVFDFEPNPNLTLPPKADDLQLFSKLLGTVWIDEKDKQVARIEAKLNENIKIGGVVVVIKKGAYLVSEQARFDDEVWLPSVSDVNISIRILLVQNIKINQVSKYTNYKKFTTEVQNYEVGKPAN
ncbi:MAG: hypothetical protein LH614_05305 [Pyrinomonadaceae bacterium]|nr:hypothetical protein [Pyrinomonadaceae bacterium]